MASRVTLDTGGSVDRAIAQLGAIPRGLKRAKANAARGLVRYVESEIAKALSAATGAPQKVFRASRAKSAVRAKSRVYWDIGNKATLQIWVGTEPLSLHHIGKVTWTRYRGEGSRPRNKPHAAGKGRGARVGRGYGVVPGTFGWAPSNRPTMVFRRRGDRSLPIERVTEPIHDEAVSALNRILPKLAERWQIEVERAIRGQLAREGFYAQSVDEVLA